MTHSDKLMKLFGTIKSRLSSIAKKASAFTKSIYTRVKHRVSWLRNGGLSPTGLLLLSVAALLCVGTVLALCCLPNAKGSTSQVITQFGEVSSISFSQESFVLSPGSQLSLRLTTMPLKATTIIKWSSSNADVAVVNSAGVITANDCGNAVITASGNGYSATTEIIVSGDIMQIARSVIESISAGSGEYGYPDAALLCERLANMSNRSTELSALYNIMKVVTADIVQEIDFESAIITAGYDREVCRTAAAVGKTIRAAEGAAAVISFTGDVTLARFNEAADGDRFPAVYASSGRTDYPFMRVKPFFSGDDMTVVNFEGTLTESRKHKNKTFYFRGDPTYATILPASGIDAANLENNHSGDYYETGTNDTERFLTSAGVSCFRAEQPLDRELSVGGADVRVVMLACECIGASPPPPSQLERLNNDIRRYSSEGAIVIVNLHWGEEGATVPKPWQQAAAHAMIDSGAMLIVGHHPHVLQGIERYNGRFIAYSLGNFAFGGNSSANNPETIILRALLNQNDSNYSIDSISIVPCYATSSGSRVNNYQPMPLYGKQADGVIDTLNRRSSVLEYGYTIPN